jgi:AcrR family transcriptional regulator
MIRDVTKGEKTKAAIVRAAILILGRDGPDGFSAAAIAREAGVSKSNVFHHFARIDEIPLAAFEALGAELYGAVAMSGRPIEAWLTALGDATADMVERNRGFLNAYFVFLSKSLFDPKLRARLSFGAEAMLSPIAAALRADRPAADAETLARLVAMMIDGYALHLLVMGGGAEAQDAWKRFARLVLQDGT